MKKLIFIIPIFFLTFVVTAQRTTDLVIPSTLSLEGERKNETWKLEFPKNSPKMEVTIYDRWGKLIFHDTNGYKNEWDGRLEGKDLPMGDYFYVIDLNDRAIKKPLMGTLTIV